MRADYVDRCQEYRSQWKPVLEGHVTAGRWQQLKEEAYDVHFHDRGGFLHVFKVC